MNSKILCAVIISLTSLSAQAHFMSNIWPQKQFKYKESGSAHASKKVLIAGTTSDFRNAIAAAIADSMAADSVYVLTADYKKLGDVDVSQWNAIILANTCIASNIENRARKFIKAHPDYRGFVLLTTSGSPDSCCASKKFPPGIDAISTASVEAKKPAVIAQVLEKVRHLLNMPSSGGKTETQWKDADATTGATSKK